MTGPSAAFDRLTLARGENWEVTASGSTTYTDDMTAVTALEFYSVTLALGTFGALGTLTFAPGDLPGIVAGLSTANAVITLERHAAEPTEVTE